MVASFTPNVQLTEPARGDDVGTWDTPVNGNTTLLDLIVGGIATVTLNNSNVVLTAAQFQCRNITFNSTLTGSVSIGLPSSFTKAYEIQNLCTGSSLYTITLTTTAAGGQVIACPPGECVDVFNDGVNIKFKNLGRVGSYLDLAVSSTPAWISACTIPPYLACTGGTVSSSIYPVLFSMIGATLPDRRGTVAANLDQGVGRLTTISSIFSVGGAQSVTLGTSQLPAHSHGVSDPGHAHTTNATTEGSGSNFQEGSATVYQLGAATINGAFTGISIQNTGGGGPVATLPPVTITGLSFIRAG